MRGSWLCRFDTPCGTEGEYETRYHTLTDHQTVLEMVKRLMEKWDAADGVGDDVDRALKEGKKSSRSKPSETD